MCNVDCFLGSWNGVAFLFLFNVQHMFGELLNSPTLTLEHGEEGACLGDLNMTKR